MSKVVVFDYGAGNLRSVLNTLGAIGAQYELVDDAAGLESAEKIILPGVGHFGQMVRTLDAMRVRKPILTRIAAGVPFLGICLGLQLLFTESEEFGRHRGLGIIPGKVVRFPDGAREAGKTLKVPHMGWNQIGLRRPAPLFKGVPDGSFVYFVHSYYVVPDDPAMIATETGYGQPFCSGIWRDNVMATQFHPEKSQALGLQMLKNFGEM